MSRDFNATTSIINISADASLNNAEPFTYMAWVYPEGMGENGGGRLADKADTGVDAGAWRVFISATTSFGFTKEYGTTSLRKITDANTVFFNRWQHVAVSWTGSNSASAVLIYLDGVVQTVYSAATDGAGAKESDAGIALRLGNIGNGTRTWDGQQAYHQLFRRVLTAEEIQAEMRQTGILVQDRVLSSVGTGSTVGLWALHGMSAVEPDFSGTRSVGTLSNTPFSANNPPVNMMFPPVQPGMGGLSGG